MKFVAKWALWAVVVAAGSGTVLAMDVVQLQQAIDAAGAKWQAGVTSVSLLSREEQKLLCGVPLSAFPIITDLPREKSSSRAHLDWRDRNGNWITDIRNQGPCGSCVAFGALAGMEAWIRIAAGDPNLPIDLSEQHLFSCGGGDCDSGWQIQSAMTYLENNGTPDNDCLPYSAIDSNCGETCADWRQRAWKLRSWEYVTTLLPSTSSIKDALEQGPVTVSMIVYEDFMDYDGGIYEHVTGGMSGGHQVCIVGYDDAQDYWICKNSWGRGWGEDGFFRIVRGDSMLGTFAVIGVPILHPGSPTPTLTPSPTVGFPTITPTPTSTPTRTPTASHPTATPPPTPSPTSTSIPATRTPTITPTRTPVRTPTRTPSPAPTFTPADPLRLGILIEDDYLEEGDEFFVWIEWENAGPALQVRQFTVLEAFGHYYFAPLWTEDLAFHDWQLPQADATTEEVLRFDWPAVEGNASGVRIWTAFLSPDTGDILCEPVFCEFGFGD